MRFARRRSIAIVPGGDGAGRALATAVAILAFLAAFAAGLAALAAARLSALPGSLAGEATVQVSPAAGRDLDADAVQALALVQAIPGVAGARALARAEAERLLEPWLGRDVDLSDLPMPRLILVQFDPTRPPDRADLAGRLRAVVPTAALGMAEVPVDRLFRFRRAAPVAAGALAALVLLAVTAAAWAATRGALGAGLSVVQVLHLSGAEDRFVVALFARHLARVGLTAGLIGAAAAAAALAALAVGAEAIGLPDGAALRPGEWAILAGAAIVVAAAFGAVPALAAAHAVRGRLRALDIR